MINKVATRSKRLESYRSLVGEDALDEIYHLASELKGLRVAHVNATANGGGVAEILKSIIPLYRGLGIDASWLVMKGNEPFFQVTKQLHNNLQGAAHHFDSSQWSTYLDTNRSNAASLRSQYDVVMIHDPQPAAMRQFAPAGTADHWIWRCHIDTSTPDMETWQTISSLVNQYDAAIFSVSEFVGPGLQVPKVSIIPPAIDPLTPKNQPMPIRKAARTVAEFGVDPERPFISQVSRFDPWKDPLGVIACFQELKESHPTLQLVLLGNFADDDPEGIEMYEKVLKAARSVPDVHVITDLTDLVNPFQVLSRVVLQKSLREGFGLTVTEALWKGTPVVAGNVGGIRLQIKDGVGGFLVDSVQECVEKVHYLLTHHDERLALGRAGREYVRSRFLLPRLLRDELTLIRDVVSGEKTSQQASGPASGQKTAIAS